MMRSICCFRSISGQSGEVMRFGSLRRDDRFESKGSSFRVSLLHLRPRCITSFPDFRISLLSIYLCEYFFFSFYFRRRVARAKEMELRKSNIISPLCSLFFTSAVHYRVSDNSFALQGLGNDCRNIASPAQ